MQSYWITPEALAHLEAGKVLTSRNGLEHLYRDGAVYRMRGMGKRPHTLDVASTPRASLQAHWQEYIDSPM